MSPALRSTRVVTEHGVGPATVVIDGGRIIAVESVARAGACEDFGNRMILPGLVDTHVHVNDPRPPEAGCWEGFDSATAAAAAGGITTLLDMPLNSLPVTTNVAALRAKQAAMARRCRVDVGLLAGLVPGNADQIGAMLAAGAVGVKAFLCHSGLDEFPNATEADLRAAMPVIAKRGAALMVHAELVGHEPPAEWKAPRSYREYLASRPDSFELDAIRLMILLCEETRCPVHIVHLSSAGALPMIVAARAQGLPLTIETCPHYLFFAAEEIADGQTLYKCAPPIRSAANQAGLWAALKSSDIDMIVSDHSPCPPELKMLATGDFPGAWGGISSLQLGLAIVWTAAAQRGLGITDAVRWMSGGPARLAGIPAGIAPGKPANLVIFDPDANFTVDPRKLFHHHPITPYAGRTLRGVVERTYLRGKVVYDQGKLVGEPIGRIVTRQS